MTHADTQHVAKSPVSESSHRLSHAGTVKNIINCHLKMNVNSRVKSGVSAERDWLLTEQWLCAIGWRAAARTHLPPVNANQAIGAAGGGPEGRVAVHVKHRQAGVERVRDDSTCVLQRNVRANVFWCVALMLYYVFSGRGWRFIADTPPPCASTSPHACLPGPKTLQLRVSEPCVLPWDGRGGRG